jgi:hypothetical protein
MKLQYQYPKILVINTVEMAMVEVKLTAMKVNKKEDQTRVSSGEFDELHSQTYIPLTRMQNAL